MTVQTVVEEAPAEPQLVSVLAQEAYFMTDCVKVVLTGGIEKLVSYEAFVEILRQVTNSVQEETLEGLNLPSNTFFVAKSPTTIQISSYYASKISNLKYNASKFDIVMPNLIISHVLSKGAKQGEWSMSSSRYFCTDLKVGELPKTFINAVKPADRVYLLPMSNTYSEGNMCFGNNQMPQKFHDNNLRGLDWYYQYLWESPFNDDLGIRGSSVSNPSTWYAKLKKLAAEGKEFPYENLNGFVPR